MIKLKIKYYFSKLIYLIFDKVETLLGYFIIFKLLPVRMRKLDVYLPRHEDIGSEYTIIMQGPIIHENEFTIETLSYYRTIFPNVRIVLSTWDSECSKACKKIEKIGVDVLLSKIPNYRGISNVNLQLTSTINGLSFLGDDTNYILKTRTDHRIYSSDNWLAYLRNKCERTNSEKGIEKKLLVCNLNMFRSRKYVVSDMFMFGKKKDMLFFWNIPHQVSSKNIDLDNEIFGFHGAETHIMYQFLESIEWDILKTKSDSDIFFHSYFSLVDKDVLELFWFKYNHFYDRKFKTVENGRSNITSVINRNDS